MTDLEISKLRTEIKKNKKEKVCEILDTMDTKDSKLKSLLLEFVPILKEIRADGINPTKHLHSTKIL